MNQPLKVLAKIREALESHRNPPEFMFEEPSLAEILCNVKGGDRLSDSEVMIYRYVFGEKEVVATFSKRFDVYMTYRRYGIPIVPLEYPHEVATTWAPRGWPKKLIRELGLNKCMIVRYLGKTIDDKLRDVVNEICSNGFTLPDISGLEHDFYKVGKFYGRMHAKGICAADQSLNNLCLCNGRPVSIDWDGYVFQLDRSGLKDNIETNDIGKHRLKYMLEEFKQEKHRNEPAFKDLKDRLKTASEQGYKEVCERPVLVRRAKQLE